MSTRCITGNNSEKNSYKSYLTFLAATVEGNQTFVAVTMASASGLYQLLTWAVQCSDNICLRTIIYAQLGDLGNRVPARALPEV